MGQTMEGDQDVLAAVARHVASVIPTTDLLQHLEQPELDVPKLELLDLFLQELGWNKEQRRCVCTATAFAQMGLDFHENVNTDERLDEHKKRQRQLSILAGDFYSSHFYALLADWGNIQLIPIIAQAISDVNQAKMRLHQYVSVNISFQQLLQEYTVIHSALYAGFTRLDGRRGPLWKKLMERLIVAERAATSPSGLTDRAVFTHPEWEKLLPSWLNEMEQLIRQATANDGAAARLRERFFYVQKCIANLASGVQG